jgi:positive regulator of sigma E activity
MTEIGKVTKINGAFVTLSCKPSPACRGCGGGACKTRGRELSARNSRNIPLKEGDYAEISLPPVQTLKASLRVFGLPLAAFALFYFCAGYFFGGGAEVPRVLSGLAGLFLAFTAVFFWGRKNADSPEVLRGVQGEEEGGESKGYLT